jgi:hypothetical protein
VVRFYTLIFVLVIGCWQAGCVFDSSALDARRCGTRGECPDGQVCQEGYCVTDGESVPACREDADCEDGQFCNGVELCSGQVEGADSAGCVAGVVPSLDDGIPCTQDACDEATDTVIHVPGADCECNQDGDSRCAAVFAGPCETGVCDTTVFACVRQVIEENETCDDGIECTQGTVCDAEGQCVGGTLDDSGCDNGLFCDGVEACNPQGDGADPETGCVPGTAPEVDDGDRCTDDFCDENSDGVVHVRNENCSCIVNEDCEPRDPDPCLRYLCQQDNTCASELQPQGTRCDDGVPCTSADVCNSQGDCSGVPLNARCDDNAFCDGPEYCLPDSPGSDLNGCVQGRDPVTVLGPQPECVEVRCDEVNDEVVMDTDECGCPGGDAAECPEPPSCQFYVCTPELTCSLQSSEARLSCEDGVSCTVDDRCDGQGSCAPGAPEDWRCDNGRFCDGEEVCAPALPDADEETGCRVQNIPEVDDGVACTQDACREDEEVVDHVPNNAFCSNGLFCDGEESCDLGLDCTPGAPPVVDDGVDCTVGSCDEDDDEVDHILDDTVCDNELFCDGEETCDPDATGADPQTGCLSADDIVVDDRVDCTVDECDEVNDRVRHTPDEGLCEGGDVCSGGVHCDRVLDCQPNSPLGDDVPCGQIDCGNGAFDATCQNGTCVLPPEGTTGDDTCENGTDDDCDGNDDGDDSDCVVPSALTLVGPDNADVGLGQEGALLLLDTEGATNQATNLYCVSRIVAAEESFDAEPGDNVVYLDDGDNELDDVPTQISFGVQFSDEDRRLGASVCDGYSMIFGPIAMPSPNDDPAYGYILVARLGFQLGELSDGQYLVMSYRTAGTNGKWVPLILVGDTDEPLVREYSFALFNGVGVDEVEVRFEVIDADDDPSDLCGFVEDVRLDMAPVLSVTDDGTRTYPQWTYGQVTESTMQTFNAFNNTAAFEGFFSERSDLLVPGMPHHHFRSENSGSVLGNNKALGYDFRDEDRGFVQMPSVSAALDFDRANPLVLDMDARMFDADLSENEIFHIAKGQNVDLTSLAELQALRKLASVLPPNLGSFTHFISHYDLGDTAFENRYAIILPEDVKPLLGRDLGFLSNPLAGGSKRFHLDNLQLYVHTAPTGVDVAVESLGPVAYDSFVHRLSVRHALEGEARVQCFWQIPGDADTVTIASDEVRIQFE